MTPSHVSLDEILNPFRDAAAKAAVRARWVGTPVLAVASARATAPEDLLPLVARWRPDSTTFFWERPADGCALLGLGVAATLRASGATRFAALRVGLARLIGTSVTAGEALEDAPFCVGGLGFGAEPVAADTWCAFPPALFVVPHLLVARRPGGCTVRLAMSVEPDADVMRRVAEVERELLRLVGDAGPQPDPPQPTSYSVSAWPPDDEWVARARDVVADIGDGHFDKVVLARTCAVHADRDFDPARVVRRLRHSYPACTTFWLSHDGSHFVGATPEVLVTLHDREVVTGAVAGSAPRGGSPEADRGSLRALQDSAKDRWEHAVVVDAIAGALRPLCDAVRVAPEAQVLTLENVHHLRTAISAQAHEGVHLLDLVEALHPTPAVAGHPRAAALAELQRREPFDRGWYSAPLGWIGSDGGGEMAVAIRSALVHGAHALLYAGAGLVRASDPEAELVETRMKLQPLLQALTEGL